MLRGAGQDRVWWCA